MAHLRYKKKTCYLNLQFQILSRAVFIFFGFAGLETKNLSERNTSLITNFIADS